MTEIQKTKKQIEVLQQKLKKLEAQESKMTLKESGNCYEVLYDHKYYYRIEFPTGYKWIKRPIGSYTWYPVDEPDIVLELEQVFNNLNDNEEKIEEAYQDYRKEREAKTLKEKDWSYKITDTHGESNHYKKYLFSVKMKELGFIKNSDGNWTANPLATKQEVQSENVTSHNSSKGLYQIIRDWCDDETDPPVSILIEQIMKLIPDKIYETSGCDDWDTAWNYGWDSYYNELLKKFCGQ